ncbi:MAG: hypothetical protein CMJ72_05150 [Planctomycetaceae bacterium]|nr:hypothetical protein [Planctomycetaceae bacterium]
MSKPKHQILRNLSYSGVHDRRGKTAISQEAEVFTTAVGNCRKLSPSGVHARRWKQRIAKCPPKGAIVDILTSVGFSVEAVLQGTHES